MEQILGYLFAPPSPALPTSASWASCSAARAASPPERRPGIASLGLRAILAATLANLMSAAIAGVLIG